MTAPAASVAEAAAARPTPMGRIAATAMASTSIEWYDFFIYATAAALVFPRLFFPADLPPVVAQLAAFSTFAVGFIARPLGAVLFGHFGDKVGRKTALVVALMIMGVATTLIGFLPTYETLGPAAPLLLIVLRLFQGLAVGGQWGGAALLVVESAPGRRGFYGSFAQMGVPLGVVLANGIFLVMGETLAPEAFESWGWRVPFVLSLGLIGLGAWVHVRLEETPEFRAAEAAQEARTAPPARSPILQLVLRNPRNLLLAGGAMVAAAGCFYIAITYVVTYATTSLGVDRNTVLWAVILGSLASTPILPITAAISDRVDRRRIFMLGAFLGILWAFPFFWLADTGQFLAIFLAIFGALAANSVMYGPQAALFSELFTAEMRYSGAALGYQLGAIVGGAFAPMIAIGLMDGFGPPAVSAYMALMCAVSLVSVALLKPVKDGGD